MNKYVDTMRTIEKEGVIYIRIPGYGLVNVYEFKSRLFDLHGELLFKLHQVSDDYKRIYNLLKDFDVVRLPEDTPKCPQWVEAFKGAGAYYTLENMIKYHNVNLYKEGVLYKKKDSMRELRAELGRYKGYQFLGMLKATIIANDFDFERSLREQALSKDIQNKQSF